jgi:hypothetical protein
VPTSGSKIRLPARFCSGKIWLPTARCSRESHLLVANCSGKIWLPAAKCSGEIWLPAVSCSGEIRLSAAWCSRESNFNLNLNLKPNWNKKSGYASESKVGTFDEKNGGRKSCATVPLTGARGGHRGNYDKTYYSSRKLPLSATDRHSTYIVLWFLF